MGKTKTVAINGEQLRAELKKCGANMMTVSTAIGYEMSYISAAVRHNKIAKSAILLLQTMYNINPDSYLVKKEPEKVETSVVEVVQHSGLTDDDLEKLYKVIYSAVYKATKRALEE